MNRLFAMSLPIVVAAVLWQTMDASPSLQLYDLLVPSGPKDFANQTVWVTGASSGIGAALVCSLAKSGAKHVVLSARRVEKMEQVIQTCQEELVGSGSDASGETFSVVQYDALDVDGTDSVVSQAIQSTPGKSIDILVLNSGIYQLQLALEATNEERRKLARINLEAPIALSHALIRQDGWEERGHGQLVVMASAMAMGPHSLCSFYAATKTALRSYFQTLSIEASSWLKVNVILPGGTASEMWNSAFGDNVKIDRAHLMKTERVADLAVKAMKGPSFLFWEVVISKGEGLLFWFMSHYLPSLFYLATHVLGMIRLLAFEKQSEDLVAIPSILKFLYKEAMGRL